MDDNITSKTTELTVSAMSAFLTPFMVSSMNIVLPSIAEEFRMNAMLILIQSVSIGDLSADSICHIRRDKS